MELFLFRGLKKVPTTLVGGIGTESHPQVIIYSRSRREGVSFWKTGAQLGMSTGVNGSIDQRVVD